MSESDGEDDQMPPDLDQVGEIVDRLIEHLINEDIDPLIIGSGLLSGALGVLAHDLDDAALLKVLENAANSVRSGEFEELRHQRAAEAAADDEEDDGLH